MGSDMKLKYLIPANQATNFVNHFKKLLADLSSDYASNWMTESQWQKKYPGIPENRANWNSVETWALEATLKHFAERIEA